MIKNNTKIWVKCMSETQKKRIQDAAFKSGFKWSNDTSDYQFLNDDTNAYYFYTNRVSFTGSSVSSDSYFNEHENTEIFWDDIMTPTKFTLDDLEDGMVVEYRNGGRDVVWKTLEMFVSPDGFMKFESYNQDLTRNTEYSFARNYDIVKVIRNNAVNPFIRSSRPNRDTQVVWERKNSEFEDQKRELIDEITNIEQQLEAVKVKLEGLKG